MVLLLGRVTTKLGGGGGQSLTAFEKKFGIALLNRWLMLVRRRVTGEAAQEMTTVGSMSSLGDSFDFLFIVVSRDDDLGNMSGPSIHSHMLPLSVEADWHSLCRSFPKSPLSE
jgi:hypothetical protein